MNAKRRWIGNVVVLSILASSAFPQGILEAVKGGNPENVKSILDNDASQANTKDDRNRTPLHYAAEAGFAKIAERLIASGAAISSIPHTTKPLRSSPPMKAI